MNNYSFIHSYNLIAQTPLIHFQWRMKDAALRASEVKPRLDKFIIKSFTESGNAVPEEWYESEKIGALDYKMQIQRTCEKEWIDINKIKSYFASKADTEDKRSIFFDCRLDIICHKPALAEYIDKIIKKFFILNVFGARQSKGFGGFLVDGTTAEEIYEEIAEKYGTFLYTETEEDATTLQKLNHIYTLYSVMKNGINRSAYSAKTGKCLFPERHIKGYAVREFLPENTGSDKAFIKTKVISGKLRGGSKTKSEYENFTFIRAMLGLADSYIFCKTDGSAERIKFYSFDETTGESREIEKFRSPVSIRVYGSRIYIFIEDTYKQMTDRNFVFLDGQSFAKYKRCENKEDRKEVLKYCPHISTPETFDPKEFLCGFAAYFEKNKEKLRAFYQEGRTDEFSGSANLMLNVVKGVSAND